MRRKSTDVQKLDIESPPLIVPTHVGVFQRIRQVRDLWKFKFWGAEASRERIETVTEQEGRSDARK